MGALALASAAGAKSSADKSMRQQTKSLHYCKQDSLPPSCFIAIIQTGHVLQVPFCHGENAKHQ
jgi:hypothetical protein